MLNKAKNLIRSGFIAYLLYCIYYGFKTIPNQKCDLVCAVIWTYVFITDIFVDD